MKKTGIHLKRKLNKTHLTELPEVGSGSVKEVFNDTSMLGTTRVKSKKKLKMSFFSRKKLRTNPEHSYIITMMFGNGTIRTFCIVTESTTFMFMKKMYHIVYEEAWYDLSLKSYHLFFFENCSVPVNRELGITPGDEEEIFFSVTPSNLKPVLKFEYLRVMNSAGTLDRTLRVMIMMNIFNLLLTALIGFLVWSMRAKLG